MYNHLRRITDVPFNADYHLFRAGIKPVWEDSNNKAGGKLTVRVRKQGLAPIRYWESLVLGLVGEELDPGLGEICGVIASVRANEVVLSIWNKEADNAEVVAELRERMKATLSLPGFVKMDYKRHINPQSSYKSHS